MGREMLADAMAGNAGLRLAVLLRERDVAHAACVRTMGLAEFAWHAGRLGEINRQLAELAFFPIDVATVVLD